MEIIENGLTVFNYLKELDKKKIQLIWKNEKFCEYLTNRYVAFKSKNKNYIVVFYSQLDSDGKKKISKFCNVKNEETLYTFYFLVFIMNNPQDVFKLGKEFERETSNPISYYNSFSTQNKKKLIELYYRSNISY